MTPRFVLAVALTNLAGWGLWRLAWEAFIPRLWGGLPPEAGLLARLGAMALTAIALAAPPVLLGAAGGWLARHSPAWLAGALSGLWALSLISTVPEGWPIAPGVWYAPSVLVMLSGLFGGWMVELSRASQQDNSVQG